MSFFRITHTDGSVRNERGELLNEKNEPIDDNGRPIKQSEPSGSRFLLAPLIFIGGMLALVVGVLYVIFHFIVKYW